MFVTSRDYFHISWCPLHQYSIYTVRSSRIHRNAVNKVTHMYTVVERTILQHVLWIDRDRLDNVNEGVLWKIDFYISIT